jgi:formylglycine-generating enzyme required for sulfatase activity
MDSSQDKPLKRLQEQKAGLENALVLAPAEDKVRLRQQIEDLDQQILERIATLQNDRSLQIGIAERQEQANDRVRVLVVTANPLGSTPLQLDREVKTIDEALRRSRKRNNFEVEYRLAATPSELRRALLDVEPHILHFSGHGAGEQGLLFVSDESAGALYRSEGGEVRATPSQTNEIRFVPAEPLAKLLGLCEEHLECVVLNACYSDVQGNAIAAYIPITIGTRDQINDKVAIKFAQGFYDAIGAGKGYEKAFEWGKVAIAFDLANDKLANVLILRKKFDSPEPIPTPEPSGAFHQIYEFSQGDTPETGSVPYGVRLSGGMTWEEVPRVLKEAKRDLEDQLVWREVRPEPCVFGQLISDYNSENQKVWYALVAVAHLDRDRFGRPLTVFRYFWCETEPQDWQCLQAILVWFANLKQIPRWSLQDRLYLEPSNFYQVRKPVQPLPKANILRSYLLEPSYGQNLQPWAVLQELNRDVLATYSTLKQQDPEGEYPAAWVWNVADFRDVNNFFIKPVDEVAYQKFKPRVPLIVQPEPDPEEHKASFGALPTTTPQEQPTPTPYTKPRIQPPPVKTPQTVVAVPPQPVKTPVKPRVQPVPNPPVQANPPNGRMTRRVLIVGGLATLSGSAVLLYDRLNKKHGESTETVSIDTPKFLGIPVEPYRYTSARVDAQGNVSHYETSAPIGKYTETALTLPAGAVPLEMVAIPGGTFRMGQTEEEKRELIKTAGQDTYDQYFAGEIPQHEVTVPDFFMGCYEVTQAQYEAVMGTNPTQGKAWVWNGSTWTSDTQIPAKFLGANKPVVGVSWDDAQEFIKRLNDLTGKSYRLPTEAEWEYAARAGSTTPFCYGETLTPAVANYNGNYTYGSGSKGEYREVTTPVGHFPANPWGLYDVHGNLCEWCADEWYDSYAQKPERLKQDGSIPWTKESSDISPSIDKARLLRGGSWYDNPRDCRSALRGRSYHSVTSSNTGFRVVVAVRIS